jgi:hypothetical protein
MKLREDVKPPAEISTFGVRGDDEEMERADDAKTFAKTT